MTSSVKSAVFFDVGGLCTSCARPVNPLYAALVCLIPITEPKKSVTGTCDRLQLALVPMQEQLKFVGRRRPM